ncbi:MAG: sialate O-acetylesterase [Bacteroidia bacterium]|nr:sialate O-acetylesterase [Bacteroidia bacterium]
MNRIKIFAFILLFSVCAENLSANIKLASLFSDHMVLQRNKTVPVWGTATPGEKVTIDFNKQLKSTITGTDGTWSISLGKLKAGGPFVFTASGQNTVTIQDVYVGEVWICSGQSNMDFTVARENRYWCGVFNEKQEVAEANFPLIRVFDTEYSPREDLQKEVAGTWEIVSPQTVGHISAVAYFFARDLQKKLKVPIGLITTAFGASTAEAWISESALQSNPKFATLLSNFQDKINKYLPDTVVQNKYKKAYEKWVVDAAKAKAEGKDELRSPKNPNPVVDQHNPYVLWNGMVAPLVHFAIAGALWYQGESNSPTASIYRDLMETLIVDWRKQWNQGDFPFIYVQLANIGKEVETVPAKGGSEAIKREAQLLNLAIPKTAMVVAIDNADPLDMQNVHPKNKQEIGKRMVLAARAIAYGEKLTYSGPIYDKMQIKGNTIQLQFKSADKGLICKGDKLKGFAIAGEDKKFVWADAKIIGNSVIVSSPDIAKPVAVRYGWGSNPPTSLYNKSDLPASPFRTDVGSN